MAKVATLEFSGGGINSDDITTGANLDADKCETRLAAHFSQNMGAVVATETRPIFAARKAGTIKNIVVVPITAPTGGDKAFTVDLQKSTAAGAFATVLSAVVTCNSSSVNRTPQTGTITTAAFIASDTFQIVLATSGTTGTQGTGVIVQVEFDQLSV